MGTYVAPDTMSAILGLWFPGTGILRNWPTAKHEGQAWTLGLSEAKHAEISLELGCCLIKLQTSDLQSDLNCGGDWRQTMEHSLSLRGGLWP